MNFLCLQYITILILHFQDLMGKFLVLVYVPKYINNRMSIYVFLHICSFYYSDCSCFSNLIFVEYIEFSKLDMISEVAFLKYCII